MIGGGLSPGFVSSALYHRDVGRLIRPPQTGVLTICNHGRALYVDPMYRKVPMHLQTQACASLDHAMLELKAHDCIDIVTPAAGPLDLSGCHRLGIT